VKNILLKTLYPILTNQGPFADHVGKHSWDLYAEMQDISVRSHQLYLQGDWELIDLRKPAQQTLTAAFQHTARVTEQIYRDHRGDCRILYTDPDTVMHRPLRIFGEYREFRLFDDKQLTGPQTEDYYSCCVRYFPEGLSHRFWRHMHRHLEQLWRYDVYAYEMEMYRQLMWLQKIDLHKPQHHIWAERSVYTHTLVDWDRIPQSIVHLGCSANLETALDIMRKKVQP